MAAEARSGQQARAGRAASEPGLATLTLTASQLGDLELILSGAFAPLRGFMTAADVAAVADAGTLADGTPWPIPVTLDVAAAAVPSDARQLMLTDPEETPLARLDITECSPVPAVTGPEPRQAASGPVPEPDDCIRLAGPVTAVREPEHGPFRRLMISPARARAELGDGPVLAFATRSPLGGRQIGQLRHLARQLDARLLLLPLVTGPADVVGQPEALIRAVLAAAASLPARTLVIPVPLGRRDRRGPDGSATTRDLAAAAIIAAAYGVSHLMADSPLPGQAGQPPEQSLPGSPIPVLPAGDWAYDPRAEVWRPHALIEAGTEIEDVSAGELGDLLDAGAAIPPWFAPEPVIRELRRARRPRSERGFVLFLTGLSGSGKSTLSRDLRDLLAERSSRRVSLLDGDLIRQLLSAGLTFSRADRDLNIARIGYVAAEVARHGGIAICAPIAPFAEARARVRAMVSEVGDFLLIHVATPLEVCEQRDRKGMYAKARAGLISQFTGVSDPYEEPDDAELVIDTSVLSRDEAAGAVLAMLTSGGWLRPDDEPLG